MACKKIARALLNCLEDAQKEHAFEQMPERIILLRHGQSQANIDHTVLSTTPDNQIELTPLGIEQSREAGRRLKALLGPSARATVILSPFERTQQTLLGLMQTLGEEAIREVHVDSRVREQEFGNLQDEERFREDQELAELVGRFYYRRPNGESSADVYDRASDLWESLCAGYSVRKRFAHRAHNAIATSDEAILIVTHGLTMRLLLMKLFAWDVDTFECVYNPANCGMWVLRKNHQTRVYELAAKECFPPRVPWACRHVRIYRDVDGRSSDGGEGGEEGEPYTIIDYLNIEAPRTSNKAQAVRQLVRGHPKLDPNRDPDAVERARAETVELDSAKVRIDWWCGRKTAGAVAMRSNLAMGGHGLVGGRHSRGSSGDSERRRRASLAAAGGPMPLARRRSTGYSTGIGPKTTVVKML